MIGHHFVLQDLIEKHDWSYGAEIGVKFGKTFTYLLDSCPKLVLLGIDIWISRPERDAFRAEGGRGYQNLDMPGIEKDLRALVAEQYPTRGWLINAFSVDAAKDIADASLDFVFIDAGHLKDDVITDINAWKPKIKHGGMLLGHDYSLPGVRYAVDALCPGYMTLPHDVWALDIRNQS